jgi:hypothetical protein
VTREEGRGDRFYAVAYGLMPGIYLGAHSAMQAVAGDRAGMWRHSSTYQSAYEWYCEQRNSPVDQLATPHYVVYDTDIFFTSQRAQVEKYEGPDSQVCIEVVPSRVDAEQLVATVTARRQKQKAKLSAKQEKAKQDNLARLKELKALRKDRERAEAFFTKRAQLDTREEDDDDEVSPSEEDEDLEDLDEDDDDEESGAGGMRLVNTNPSGFSSSASSAPTEKDPPKNGRESKKTSTLAAKRAHPTESDAPPAEGAKRRRAEKLRSQALAQEPGEDVTGGAAAGHKGKKASAR